MPCESVDFGQDVARVDRSTSGVDDEDGNACVVQNVRRNGAAQESLPDTTTRAADDDGGGTDTLGKLGNSCAGNARFDDTCHRDRFRAGLDVGRLLVEVFDKFVQQVTRDIDNG